MKVLWALFVDRFHLSSDTQTLYLLFLIQHVTDFFRNLSNADRFYDIVPDIRKPGITFHNYLAVSGATMIIK